MSYVQTGLLVGEKYCLKLCDYLPSNYKKAIQKLRNLTYLSREDVKLILNPTEGQPIDLVAVNQRIIRHLQMNQSHTDLLAVCREMDEHIKQKNVHEYICISNAMHLVCLVYVSERLSVLQN